ncbi:CapA family protein [Reichenbachiella versicolor]|uniref:CapA family protein n=1 Tax=Reichenbachiella versicolor TaxID=1821036 RepID=UPI0013A57E4E|nr:CapA family protein [Reichenbachiella versicolor]
MRRFLVFGLILHCIWGIISCTDHVSYSITFTGDLILDGGVSENITLHGDSLLVQSIQPYLQGDNNIINLECVLLDSVPIRRQNGKLAAPSEWAQLLREGNVTHASIANNHADDYGKEGIEVTLNALYENQIKELGNSCEPKLIGVGEHPIAVFSACLTTSCEPFCLNSREALLDAVQVFTQLSPDVPTVLYVHWGLEYQLASKPWQQEFARQLIDAGLDAVIGHHPHVFQEVELYKGKPILYSLGNFVADAYLPNTTQGVVAHLTVDQGTVSVALKPVDLSSYFPHSMDFKSQVKMLGNNLKYSQNLGYAYQEDSLWVPKALEEVTFNKSKRKWLFHIEDQYDILIKKLKTGDQLLTLWEDGTPIKSMTLHGELTDIQIGDVTNDGETEFVFGIKKKVRFDPSIKKRINVFRIEDGGVKTVWMGTKFLHDVAKFSIIHENGTNYLRTHEFDSARNTYIRTYQWDQFGFENLN